MPSSITVKTNGQTLSVNTSISHWTTEALANAASTSNDVEPSTWTTATSDYAMYFANTAQFVTVTVKQSDGSTIYTGTFKAGPGAGARTIDPLPSRDQVATDLFGSFRGRLQSGKYHFCGGSGATTTQSAIAEILFVSPWVVPNPVSVTKIGAEVTGAGGAGSVIRLGIYADSAGVPGALVLDAGTIDGTSATVQEISLSSPTTLNAGLYWVGGVNQVGTAATMRAFAGTVMPDAPIAQSTIPTTNNIWYGYQVTPIAGALPATFGTATQSTVAVMRTFVKTG